LNLGISTKIIQAEHINMVDGNIINITGLSFNSSTRELSLRGYSRVAPQALHEIPINYTPVKQENYEKLYVDVLEYHALKASKLGLKGTVLTQLPQTFEPEDEF
jgi:hypothetical protein